MLRVQGVPGCGRSVVSWKEIPVTPGLEVGTKGYQKDVEDGHLTCLVSHSDPHGYHLSLSHRLNEAGPDGTYPSGRLPTWDEIKEARYLWVPNHVRMTLHLPPREEYVNVMDTCMHLYECRC